MNTLPKPVEVRIKPKKRFTLTCVDCATEFETLTKTAQRCLTCRQRHNAYKRHTFNYPLKVCVQCQKEYKPISTQQKYCNSRCESKFLYHKHIEYHRERDRIRIRKQRLGLDIRDEHLSNPTKYQKWLWDGIGKWSVKYWPDIQECLECNTSVYKHAGNGLCEVCYNKLRERDAEMVKESQRKSYLKKKSLGKPSSRKESQVWIAKAKEQRIPITPKIANILDNLERL